MENCHFCGKPLRESQIVTLENIAYKSCPKCSQSNPNNEHIYYSHDAFGYSKKRITHNNPLGVQSLCPKCRSKQKGPYENAISCSDINLLMSKTNIQNSELYEGILKEITILQKTRNKEIVKNVKERDDYTCCACGFYFENKIVEAHHLIPIADKDEKYIVNAEDLITLCPTCHSLAHTLLNKDKKFTNRDILVSELKIILNLK